MRPTCVLTVASATNRSGADLGVRPPARHEHEHLALAVGEVGDGAACAGRWRPPGSSGGSAVTRCSSSRRVLDGAMTASPACTVRIAASISSGGASLSRNPLAPARIAASTYSSRSNVVSTMTRGRRGVVGGARGERAVAASPSIAGIRTSMSTTSTGPVASAPRERAHGLRPVARLEHDLEVGLGVDDHAEPGADQLLVVDERDADRCRRSSGGLVLACSARGWSARRAAASAGRGRGVGRGGQLGAHPEPAAGAGAGADRAAEHRGPLAHAEQPWPAPSPSAAAPRPSSLTSTHERVGDHCTSTVTVGSGPACLSTLVSASWQIRYTVSPAPGGRCAARPCGRARRAGRSRGPARPARRRPTRRAAGRSPGSCRGSARPGRGARARAPVAVGRRGAVRAARRAAAACPPSAARPVSAMVPSARVAAAGSAPAAYRPPSAWAMITDSEWATMSCISRAIRARSAAVAIWACWSRSTSSRSARSTRASIVSRRDRRTSPNAQTARATNAGEDRGATRRRVRRTSRSARCRAATEPTSAPTIATRCAHRGPCTVTEYRASRTAKSAGTTSGAKHASWSRATE